METDSAKRNNRYLIEKRKRLRIAMTALPALIAILLWLFASGLDERYLEYSLGFRREVIVLVVVSLFAFSGFSLLLTYLQTGFGAATEVYFEAVHSKVKRAFDVQEEVTTAKTVEMHDAELRALREQIQSMRAALGDLDDGSRAKLIAELKAELQNDASTAFLDEIRSKVTANEKRNAQDRELPARLDESRLRLQRELDALGRRGNLNLALGAITTVVGISLLGFSVFAETSTAKDIWALASHFLPRLALVLLIELFAFFFLSLYKSSLSEIKYFQNELTNIESRQLALSAAIASMEPALLVDVIGKLASTERNHILTKDQTTIELEKVRIDRDSQSTLVKAMAEFFQKKA